LRAGAGADVEIVDGRGGHFRIGKASACGKHGACQEKVSRHGHFHFSFLLGWKRTVHFPVPKPASLLIPPSSDISVSY
jgi:hypothetical protein